MPELFAPSLDDQITEVWLEIRQRHRVYGRMVADGRMKAEQSERKIAVMEAVLETLRGLK